MRHATTVQALGTGLFPGEKVFIQVTDPITNSTNTIKLTWHDASQKWVSGPKTYITGFDGGFISRSGNEGDWSYWGIGGSLGKWNLRAIPYVDTLWAAGLRLQDRMSARILDSGSGIQCYVAPWFYDYPSDNTGRILYSNDRSAQATFTWNGHADLGFAPSKENVGHGVVLKSIGDNIARLISEGQYDDNIVSSPYHTLVRGKDWDYIKLFVASQPVGQALGGVPTSVPFVPTKHWLYPTLYGMGATNAGSQGTAAIHYQVRWSS